MSDLRKLISNILAEEFQSHTFEPVVGDGVEHVITPGSYAHQPAREVHGDRCRGPEDCLILVQMDGPNTFVVAE